MTAKTRPTARLRLVYKQFREKTIFIRLLTVLVRRPWVPVWFSYACLRDYEQGKKGVLAGEKGFIPIIYIDMIVFYMIFDYNIACIFHNKKP